MLHCILDSDIYLLQKRKRAKTTSAPNKADLDQLLDDFDGELSDGHSALRDVQKRASDARPDGARGPRNRSLEFFKTPNAVAVNGKKKWEFMCKLCGASRRIDRTTDSPNFAEEEKRAKLNNLAGHLSEKHAAEVAEARARPGQEVTSDGGGEESVPRTKEAQLERSRAIMAAMLEKGRLNPAHKPSQQGFNRYFAAWLLESDQAFSSGKVPSLRALFDYIRCDFTLPSDVTVRNTIARIYISLRDAVVEELANVKSKIAYSTDSWTNQQMIFTFAGTLANWIDDDWDLITRVIDFRHLDDHSGIGTAKAFYDAASRVGSLNKLFSITMDNAASNTTCARVLGRLLLARYGVGFRPENGQIRCLAHIVNLVVQKILATLKEVDDPEKQDYYELLNKHLPVNFDIAEEIEDLKALEDDEYTGDYTNEDDVWDPEETSKFDKMTILEKLRTIVQKIVSSPLRRANFRRIAIQEFGKEVQPNGYPTWRLMPIRDVRTRWNSTHAMIGRALILKKAVEVWVFQYEDLRPLLLSKSEWEMVGELHRLLELFTSVTNTVSTDRSPTLPWVIPLYWGMKSQLDSYIHNDKVDFKLRAAASEGKAKLMEYFNLAVSCQHNVIATICHPYLRTDWFLNLGNDRHQNAKTIFEHVYKTYAEESVPTSKPEPTPKPAHSLTDPLALLGRRPENPAPVVVTPVVPEIDRWMSGEGGFGDHRQPLQWWKIHAADFPVISRMARDFLAIPAASVSVERLFSSSRHLCRDTRSSMTAATITEAMCTKKWLEDEALYAKVISKKN